MEFEACKYLPFLIGDVPVLLRQADGYLVDNSWLKSQLAGLTVRNSKDNEGRDEGIIEFGSTVHGIIEDSEDGVEWLKVTTTVGDPELHTQDVSAPHVPMRKNLRPLVSDGAAEAEFLRTLDKELGRRMVQLPSGQDAPQDKAAEVYVRRLTQSDAWALPTDTWARTADEPTAPHTEISRLPPLVMSAQVQAGGDARSSLGSCSTEGQAQQSNGAPPIVSQIDLDGVAQLQRRLQSTQEALAQSEHTVVTFQKMLDGAKASIETLGEEADVECHSLYSELESKQAALDAALAAAQQTATAEPVMGPARLAAEAGMLNQELRRLRDSDANSREQSSRMHQEMAAGLASLRERVQGTLAATVVPAGPDSERLHAACRAEDKARAEATDLHRQCVVHEDAVQRMSLLQRQQQQACEARIVEAATAQQSAEEACADVQRQLQAARAAQTALESRSEALVLELDETGAELTRVRSACQENERSSLEAAEKLATAEGALAVANEALATPEAKLQQEIDHHMKGVRESTDKQITAQAAACQEAQDAAHAQAMVMITQSTQENRARLAESRWAQLVIAVGRAHALDKVRVAKRIWSTGNSRKGELIAQMAEQLRGGPTLIQDLERQCEQGERRLAALEQLHASHVDRAAMGARAVAAEIQEAEAAWRAELEDLRSQVHHWKARVEKVEDDNLQDLAKADAESARADTAEAALREAIADFAQPHQVQQGFRCSSAAQKELEEEVSQLKQKLASAEEAIGMLVAGGATGGDGGSGGPTGA